MITIPLTSDRAIGPVLRKLRTDAGLTVRQVARRSHISASGVSKRENRAAGHIGFLIEHTRALGFAVALIPQRHPGARPTGTGWPA